MPHSSPNLDRLEQALTRAAQARAERIVQILAARIYDVGTARLQRLSQAMADKGAMGLARGAAQVLQTRPLAFAAGAIGTGYVLWHLTGRRR